MCLCRRADRSKTRSETDENDGKLACTYPGCTASAFVFLQAAMILRMFRYDSDGCGAPKHTAVGRERKIVVAMDSHLWRMETEEKGKEGKGVVDLRQRREYEWHWRRWWSRPRRLRCPVTCTSASRELRSHRGSQRALFESERAAHRSTTTSIDYPAILGLRFTLRRLCCPLSVVVMFFRVL